MYLCIQIVKVHRFMKRLFLLSQLLCNVLLSGAQTYFEYKNNFHLTRSDQTAFSHLILLAPRPQSCDYQDIFEVKGSPAENWEEGDVEENDNMFLRFSMNQDELIKQPKDFDVSYTFICSPKTIKVDFSQFKNADGTWKDMPEYDTTTSEYQDNTEQSGDIVVPDNSTIQTISDNLFNSSKGNKLAYAENCYKYVASHYKYLNPLTGLHTLEQILADGGGDCGNLSTIYISLLRAKGIPARHVIAYGDKNYFHVWSEFLIQGFGWVPVDVTYKNGNPSGNYFGRYNYDMVVVQKGCVMDYLYAFGEECTIDLLQTYYYWYWCDTYATMNVKQTITAKAVDYDGIQDVSVQHPANKPQVKKMLKNGRLIIIKEDRAYDATGIRMRQSH